MALNFDSLAQSIQSLRKAIDYSIKNKDVLTGDLEDIIHAGVIQNFEVTYEQSWKMIQRWIKENKTPQDANNPRTRKDLFRKAAQYNLIKDPKPWFTFGEVRNITSHTYDKKNALSVYKTAQLFLPEVEFLLQQLEQMND